MHFDLFTAFFYTLQILLQPTSYSASETRLISHRAVYRILGKSNDSR